MRAIAHPEVEGADANTADPMTARVSPVDRPEDARTPTLVPIALGASSKLPEFHG